MFDDGLASIYRPRTEEVLFGQFTVSNTVLSMSMCSCDFYSRERRARAQVAGVRGPAMREGYKSRLPSNRMCTYSHASMRGFGYFPTVSLYPIAIGTMFEEPKPIYTLRQFSTLHRNFIQLVLIYPAYRYGRILIRYRD